MTSKLDIHEHIKIIKNKKLIEKYPWLMPRDRFTGETCNNNYESTELDNMIDGWRQAFGDQMCEEIQQELIKENLVDEYVIDDIKEKYGSLRWYSHPVTTELINIINKYEKMSENTCVICGNTARWLFKGLMLPCCDTCAKRAYDTPSDYFAEIDDYILYME